MITYKLDADKDLFVLNGTIATVVNLDETAQDVTTKFKTVQGELFYDIDFGVPYFTVIFKKPFDKDLADTIMRQTIYSSPTVTEITSFQSDIDSFARRYRVNFVANTQQQETIAVNEEFKF